MTERLTLHKLEQNESQQDAFNREVNIVVNLIKLNQFEGHAVVGIYGPFNYNRQVFKEEILSNLSDYNLKLVVVPNSKDTGNALLQEISNTLRERQVETLSKKLNRDFNKFYKNQIQNNSAIQKALKTSLPTLYGFIAYFLSSRAHLNNEIIQFLIGILAGASGYLANFYGKDMLVSFISRKLGKYENEVVLSRITGTLRKLPNPFLVVLDQVESLDETSLKDLLVTVCQTSILPNLIFVIFIDKDSITHRDIQTLLRNTVTSYRYVAAPSLLLIENYWKQQITQCVKETTGKQFGQDTREWSLLRHDIRYFSDLESIRQFTKNLAIHIETLKPDRIEQIDLIDLIKLTVLETCVHPIYDEISKHSVWYLAAEEDFEALGIADACISYFLKIVGKLDESIQPLVKDTIASLFPQCIWALCEMRGRVAFISRDEALKIRSPSHFLFYFGEDSSQAHEQNLRSLILEEIKGTNFYYQTFVRLAGHPIRSIVEEGDRVYAAAHDGLYISENQGGEFYKFTMDPRLNHSFVRGVSAMGHLVCLATDEGLFVSFDSGKSFELRTVKNGLGDNLVYGTFISNSRIYAATNKGLAISVDSEAHKFKNFGATDGLGSDVVYSVFVDYRIYAATMQGLSICDRTEGGRFQNYTNSTRTGCDIINGICVLDSKVYLATNKGLSILDDVALRKGNHMLIDSLSISSNPRSNIINDVLATFEGRRSKTDAPLIYLATANGLWISGDAAKSFSHVEPSKQPILQDELVNSVYVSNSVVYIGTRKGLSRVPQQQLSNLTKPPSHG
jgi:hypothetical protein